MLTRRSLLQLPLAAAATPAPERLETVRFGMIADVHHGLIADAEERLERFLEACEARPLDFVIQLGDFCHPGPASESFRKKWLSTRAPRYSVLGNHDMDYGTKRQIMADLEMPANYYSFDLGGYHLAVLDCNYLNNKGRFEDFANSNYFRTGPRRDWVSAEQLEWLKADLTAARKPTLIFMHQGIGSLWGLPEAPQRVDVRKAIAAVPAHGTPVVAAFCGHSHADHHAVEDGIHHVWVNSSSYYWVGESYGSLARYREPLYSFVTLDASRVLTLEGRRSEFIPPSPRDLRHPDGSHATAVINDLKIHF